MRAIVVGGGPAGLMAAETLASIGHGVTIVDGRRSMGRKFLLAGRSGLNLTHDEPLDEFVNRFGLACERLEPALRSFGPADLRSWADELGAETYVGSSGRVFPAAFRATPLLRAWIDRLGTLGVVFRPGLRWTSFGPDRVLHFLGDEGESETIEASVVVFALGGASWPRVGGDGGWVGGFGDAGIDVAALAPANCGVHVEWTSVFSDRFAGTPLKNVSVSVGGHAVRGEPTVTVDGLEGSAIYAHGPALRTAISNGNATLHIELQPDITEKQLAMRLSECRRKKDSVSTWLRRGGFSPVEISLMREATGNKLPPTAARMAVLAKSVPVAVTGQSSLERAISTAGGIAFDEVDESFMLKKLPGVFVAGEMLDWEAPTGGYLLQGCLSTGRAAGAAAAAWAAARS